MRAKISFRLLIPLTLFLGMLLLGPQRSAAQVCGTIGLDCLSCGGPLTELMCCFPPNCMPIEAANGNCDNPAECAFMCNGTITDQLYYCSGGS